MVTVEEFSALTQEEQIARIQELGERALVEFGVKPTEIKPLVHFENTTYYITSDQGEFNLRISRPGVQTVDTLQSEMEFLTALRGEGFRVPEPYQNRLVTVGAPGVPEERHVALLGWMHGEFLRDRLTPVEARLIGRTMARLHDFSLRWERPTTFMRPHLYEWAISDRLPKRQFDEPISGLPEEDRLFLLELELEARAVFAELPRTPETYGLIHSDLHVGNLLLEDGHINVIDFDDTGFGFFYFDFAAALGFHLQGEQFVEIRDAMLSGYEEVRPLPPQTRKLLRAFLRIRMGGVSRWILDRVDNPQLRETGPEWVHQFCEGLRRLDLVNNT